MKNTLLLCFVVGAMIACSPPPPPPVEILQGEEYSREIQEIIQSKNDFLVEAYRTGEIEEASEHFAENCIQFTPHDRPIKGREDYVNTWNQMVSFGTWEFSLVANEVRAIESKAVEHGIYKLKFTPNETSPMPPIEDTGNYLVLWEKIDGEWLVVWDAPVSELPLPMPPDMAM